MSKISALVLAAGQSTRMGSTNKLLVKLNQKTLLQHVLSNLQQSSIDEIIVVTGFESNKVESSIASFDVKCVENTQFAQGLSSSIKVGMENLSKTTEGVLVCHGDMPLVDVQSINAIINAFIKNQKIIIPTYLNQKGNPLLWPKSNFESLKQLNGDSGARQILKQHKNNVLQLEVNNISILFDIDDLQTLEFIQSKFDKRPGEKNGN